MTVARFFCPRAAKLPGNPGKRGGRALAGSGAKIHCVPTETTTGPTTTWPLTPHLLPSDFSQGSDWAADPPWLANLFRDWSRSWTRLDPPHIPPKHTDVYPFSGRIKGSHPHIHTFTPRGEHQDLNVMWKGYRVCGLLAHEQRHTHTHIYTERSQQDLKLRLEILCAWKILTGGVFKDSFSFLLRLLLLLLLQVLLMHESQLIPLHIELEVK